MRTVLLIALTLVALVGGFLLVGVLLPDPPAATARQEVPAGVAALPEGQAGARAEDFVLRRFDESTGRVAAEFRAAQWRPQGDRQVVVERPELRFFADDGGVIFVSAESGVIDLAEAGQRPEDMGLPKSGRLADVRFALADAPDADPQVQGRVDNLVFDAETYEFATGDARIGGDEVLGERIPVTVRGRDYDFDGEGLEARWNPADGRLELLRIFHGRRLVIRDPALLEQFGPDDDTVAAARSRRMLAAQDGPGDLPPIEDVEDVYEASFRDDVIVSQGGQTLATARLVAAVFALPEDEAGGAARRPGKRGDTPAPPPPTGPTPEPLVIEWRGPLEVRPPDGPTRLEHAADWHATIRGDARQPVRLRRDGLALVAGEVTYEASADAVTAVPGEAVPAVELSDGSDLMVRTAGLRYAGGGGVATLAGPGEAAIVEDGGRAEVRWREAAQLRFGGQAGDALESAEFAGDVRVDHPQLDLAADGLRLAFDPPAAGAPATGANRPAGLAGLSGGGGVLRQVVATGRVTADLADEQSVAADRLTLLMDDAGEEPRQIELDGGVVAEAQGQTVRADVLTADVGAGAAGELELVGLVARGGVTVEGDGLTAAGDLLMGRGGGDQQRWRLVGEPVRVTRGGDVLTGRSVTFDPATEAADLEGPGTLDAVAEVEGESGPARVPVRVTWEQGAAYDPAEGRIDLAGPITAVAERDAATTYAAEADAAQVFLADAPAGGAADVGRPQVERIELSGQVDLNLTERAGDNGEPVLRMHLLSEAVAFDAAAGRMLVPGPGQILYDDRRPAPEPAADAGDAGAGVAQKLGDFRGVAGLRWDEKLEAAEAGEFEVVGNARVAARPAEGVAAARGVGERFNVRADRLSGTTARGPGRAMQLASAAAEGGVDFTSADVRFTGDAASYDAQTGTVVARQPPGGRPLEVFTGDGRVTAGLMVYDTQTGQVRLRDVVGRGR